MDQLYEYLTDVGTIVNVIVFVFGLGVTWSNLNGRIKKLEEETEKIDATKIEAKLAEIQTDLARIKNELNKMDK